MWYVRWIQQCTPLGWRYFSQDYEEKKENFTLKRLLGSMVFVVSYFKPIYWKFVFGRQELCPWKERIINTIMVSPWRLPTLSVKATVRPLILLQILNNIEENKHPNNFLSTAACCQDQLCKLCHNRCSKPWWAGPGAAWYNIKIMPASRRRLDEMISRGLLKPAFVFFCDSMFLLGRHSFSVRSYTFTLRI